MKITRRQLRRVIREAAEIESHINRLSVAREEPGDEELRKAIMYLLQREKEIDWDGDDVEVIWDEVNTQDMKGRRLHPEWDSITESTE